MRVGIPKRHLWISLGRRSCRSGTRRKGELGLEGAGMGDFDCRVCGTDLSSQIRAALVRNQADFRFQRKRQDKDDYRIVEVECPNQGHPNSFRLRAATGGG